MEHIGRKHVHQYGVELADRCERGEMSPATAQNYVSAVNSVMEMARGDREAWASPTRDCGIPERSGIADADRSVSQADHAAARENVSVRLGAQLDLQREMGLRFKESCLINPKAALSQHKETGKVTIEDGTKGGRARELEPSPAAIAALERAAEIQQSDRSMVPADQTYASYATACYREISLTDTNFHGERHNYAQGRYEQETGVQCPVVAGVEHGQVHHEYMAEQLAVSVGEAKAIDHDARDKIAEELGHGRAEITNAYLG